MKSFPYLLKLKEALAERFVERVCKADQELAAAITEAYLQHCVPL